MKSAEEWDLIFTTSSTPTLVLIRRIQADTAEAQRESDANMVCHERVLSNPLVTADAEKPFKCPACGATWPKHENDCGRPDGD